MRLERRRDSADRGCSGDDALEGGGLRAQDAGSAARRTSLVADEPAARSWAALLAEVELTFMSIEGPAAERAAECPGQTSPSVASASRRSCRERQMPRAPGFSNARSGRAMSPDEKTRSRRSAPHNGSPAEGSLSIRRRRVSGRWKGVCNARITRLRAPAPSRARTARARTRRPPRGGLDWRGDRGGRRRPWQETWRGCASRGWMCSIEDRTGSARSRRYSSSPPGSTDPTGSPSPRRRRDTTRSRRPSFEDLAKIHNGRGLSDTGPSRT